jgi:hypothetical protein
MEAAHVSELAGRFPDAFLADMRPPWAADTTEDTMVDPTGQLDGFVLRCMGTVIELEDHQNAGGRILLEFEDGTLRELTINTSRDGVRAPHRLRAILPRRATRGRARHFWRI